MRSAIRSMVLTVLGILPAADFVRSQPFQPGPLTPQSLRIAAAAAGFRVREVMADVPAAVRTSLRFTPLDYDDPQLAGLREKYPLDAVISRAQDEWNAQLLLKDWIFRQIPGGNPTSSPANALEILSRAAKGERFYCTQYAITYAECALALGWQARKIAVDRKHGPEGMGSTHHGVAEVWSNQWRKWVVMDSQSNLHFEKDGMPLSAWEIRREWLTNRGAGVDHVVGVPPHAAKKNPAIVWWTRADEDETATYFWLHIADRVGQGANTRYILPVDEFNAGSVWYQNDSESRQGRLHTGYLRNFFLPTRSLSDAYWTVGVVEAHIVSVSDGALRLRLDSYDPYRTGYEISTDGVTSSRVTGEAPISWPLKPGWNSLRLRTTGRRGVTGPEAAVLLLLERP